MARTRQLKAELVAKDKASKVIRRVSSAVKILGVTAAAVGAVQIGRKLVSGIKDAIAKAAIQEAQERKLAAALSSTGKFSEALFATLKDQAAALQRVTDEGDETIIEMQSLLLQFGANEKGVTALAEATLDMAKTFGQDATSAVVLVGKALGGNIGALSRYGVEVDAAAFKVDALTAVQAGLLDKFGGRARAEAGTFTGTINQLENAWGDLLERFGDAIIKSNAVREALSFLQDEVERFTASLEGDQGQQAVKDMVISLVDLSEALLIVGTTSANALRFIVGMGIAMKETLNPFADAETRGQRVGDAMSEMGLSMQDAANETAGILGRLDALRERVLGVDTAARSSAEGLGNVARTVETLGEALDKSLADAGIKSTKQLTEQVEALDVALRKAGTALLAGELSPDRFNAIFEAIEKGVEGIVNEGGLGLLTEQLKNLTAGIQVEPLLDTFEAIDVFVESGAARLSLVLGENLENLKSLSSEIKRTLRNEGVNAALSFGDALVDAAFAGEFAFDKFFKALLADLAKAIVQALFLRAILSLFGGGGGAIAGGVGASVGGSFAGGLVAESAFGPIAAPGPAIGISPISIDPGLTQAALASASQPQVNITLVADGAMFLGEDAPPQLARQLSDLIASASNRGLTRASRAT